MTIAVIVTVAISLSLAGAGLLIGRQVATMKGYWYDKVEVSVFLTNDIAQPDRDVINTKLHDLPQVQTVYYESKADAFNRFKDQFKDSPDLVRNVTPMRCRSRSGSSSRTRRSSMWSPPPWLASPGSRRCRTSASCWTSSSGCSTGSRPRR